MDRHINTWFILVHSTWATFNSPLLTNKGFHKSKLDYKKSILTCHSWHYKYSWYHFWHFLRLPLNLIWLCFNRHEHSFFKLKGHLLFKLLIQLGLLVSFSQRLLFSLSKSCNFFFADRGEERFRLGMKGWKRWWLRWKG